MSKAGQRIIDGIKDAIEGNFGAVTIDGQRWVKAAKWRSCADYLPPEYETVLTQHYDDLFPVAAFHMGGVWLREIEGPEDVPAVGKHEELRQPPTHWMPLPEPPVKP